MKATFFAVFASFTNLALSASALGSKYLNEIFVITREVKDKVTGNIVSSADYSELGILMMASFGNSAFQLQQFLLHRIQNTPEE